MPSRGSKTRSASASPSWNWLQNEAMLVSGNYLETVSARPYIGRIFDTADAAGAEIPAVVSHRFWSESLGGGSSVAGRTVTLNGRSFSIVGVLPDDFQGPNGLFAPEVWLPLDRADVLNLPANLRGDERWLTLFGRLAAGITTVQASAELTALATTLRPPRDTAGPTVAGRFHPMSGGHPRTPGSKGERT